MRAGKGHGVKTFLDQSDVTVIISARTRVSISVAGRSGHINIGTRQLTLLGTTIADGVEWIPADAIAILKEWRQRRINGEIVISLNDPETGNQLFIRTPNRVVAARW